MLIVNVTATYDQDADTVFAGALNFDLLNQNMSGLFEYRDLPSGDMFEGQFYSFTPILWTIFQFPQTDITCVKIDHTARICANVSTQQSGLDTPYETRNVIHITPTASGCLWTDRIDMTGPRPGRLARAITRHLQKATHRRRGAMDVRVEVYDR